jgi:hypothetical protein
VLLLDPHNEYARAFGDQAVVLSPDAGLRLPYWLFNFEELAEIVLGAENAHPSSAKFSLTSCSAPKQTHFLRTGLEKNGTIDTPVLYACRMYCGRSKPQWAR